MLFWEGSIQKYWLRSSKSLEKGINPLLSTGRLLCIFDTRLLFILMKLQTHQYTLGLFSWFPINMLFWGGSMQKYWLRRSKSLEKGMNPFISTRRLLCIFGTRLSFILMKLQTHQGSLGPVFMISYKHVVLRR